MLANSPMLFSQRSPDGPGSRVNRISRMTSRLWCLTSSGRNARSLAVRFVAHLLPRLGQDSMTTTEFRASNIPPNNELLRRLDRPEIDSILAAAQPRRFSARSFITRQDQPAN